jgi:hypothetical protein
LSESKEELIAVGDSHGWNLKKLNIHDLTVSGDTLRDDSRYTVFHPAEVELDETTKAVLNEVERLIQNVWCSIRSLKCECWRATRSDSGDKYSP